MASRICMNTSCGATSTSQWKKGWILKSGQIADLCFNCGSAFEKLAFCDTFHSEEAGWRECSLCNKRLHCGCSASATFIEVQDFGGVWCINCAQSAGCHRICRDRVISEAHTHRTLSYGNFSSLQVNNVFNGEAHSARSLLSLGNSKEPVYKPQLPSEHANASTAAHMRTEVKCSLGFSNLSQPPTFSTPSEDELNTGGKDTLQPQAQPSLDIQLSSSADAQNCTLALPVPSVAAPSVEDGEKTTAAPLLYHLPAAGKKPRHILPKPHLKINLSKGSEVTAATKHKVSGSLLRIARPPAEGRLRNQLLPRYWPRISDQELQELSGDLNSTIVPLFEKILSASDASRIGRLVLPKACAEAYFPPINQSEGLPLKIQDVKGNEWTFQFRFWPNNNSRMYVLEGVTPCIQSMQLQAGDTVIFSRIDPGGKLVMGFRKASNSPESQDPPATSSHNDVALTGENIGPHATNNQATANGYSNFSHSMGGSKENNTTVMSELSNLKSGDNDWSKIEKVNKDLMQQPRISSDKKRSRNIGSKSKRLSWQHEDALELRISWEEIQDLLRAPPSVQPNVITIDEFEFEEYSEPPVFGKRTLFTTRFSGGQDQWAQCDKCAKWRKLPVDVLLPSKWSCSDNFWDSNRSSCSIPAESGSKQLDNLLKAGKETKKRRTMGKTEVTGQGSEEPSGLDALATAAALGDDDEVSGAASSTTVTTTRHPRHKPGCSCIVCIQPPSGKGKHKPNCVCNVCMTVKRRFKTLMIRKKKRQSEREAEAESEMIAQPTRQDQKRKHDQPLYHSSSAQMGTTKEEKFPVDCMDIDSGSISRDLPAEGEDTNGSKEIIGTTSTNNIDLNCHPIREDETRTQLHADRNLLNITPERVSQSQVCSLGYEPKQLSSASVAASTASVLVQFLPCQVKEQNHQPSEGDQIFQQKTPDQDDYHRDSVVSP